MADAKKQKELEELMEKYGLTIPDRGNLDNPDIKWRVGKPNYLSVNLEYLKGKSMNHPPNSWEKKVEDMVKTWEMEALHKVDPNQWDTVDLENFKVQVNGGKIYDRFESSRVGTYNWLLNGCQKELYDNENETFETSHKKFYGTFKDGFAFEVLKVYSGPPKIVCTFRHWGRFNGEYKGIKGDNEVYEMYGAIVVSLNEEGKITFIEVFYKPDDFLRALETYGYKDLQHGQALVGTTCPIVH